MMHACMLAWDRTAEHKHSLLVNCVCCLSLITSIQDSWKRFGQIGLRDTSLVALALRFEVCCRLRFESILQRRYTAETADCKSLKDGERHVEIVVGDGYVYTSTRYK